MEKVIIRVAEDELAQPQLRLTSLMDETGHLVNRNDFAQSLSEIYKDLRVGEYVSDAQLLIALGLAEYLAIGFFVALTGQSYENLPRNLDDFEELVASCLDENGWQKDFENRSNSYPADIRGEIIERFSVGTKLCACIEAGLVDEQTALKMLKQAMKRSGMKIKIIVEEEPLIR